MAGKISSARNSARSWASSARRNCWPRAGSITASNSSPARTISDFPKSAAETLRFWDREKILADTVWAIRKFRPDVIVTRFPPDDDKTHGHHTSSAILAQEAFKLAADPKKFPEQLKLVAAMATDAPVLERVAILLSRAQRALR